MDNSYAGRTLAVSTIVVHTPPGPAGSEYKYAQEFEDLARADNTGNINDLPRDDATIAGRHDLIPSHEVFFVDGQDNIPVVFDAWFLTGTTDPNNHKIIGLQQTLIATPITEPRA